MKPLPQIRSFTDLTTPPGTWQELYEGVEARGVNYRRGSLLAYAKGLKLSLERNTAFGIRLVHEADNEHDPLAVKVVGHWHDCEAHLGYLPYKMAHALHNRHRGKTVGARLVDFDLDIAKPNVLIDVLFEI